MLTRSIFPTIATGFAMFSMFFGAGNAIFPLALGYQVQGGAPFAIAGLLISAVLLPFLGLFGIYLFEGESKSFFETIGRRPGFVVSAFILTILGPCGAIPRCVALSYATIKTHLPSGFGIIAFALVAMLCIFLFSLSKKRFIPLLGAVLTPLLLIALGILIYKGLLFPGTLVESTPPFAAFFTGLKEGYGTMDLISSFFFAPVIIQAFRKEGGEGEKRNLLCSCLIGGSLLAITYIGFCFVAAFSAPHIANAPVEELMHQIAQVVLGPSGSLILSIIIALACLTTAIAISLVFANFIQNTLSGGRMSYAASLAITCCITFIFASLEFNGLRAFLTPLLITLYPALFTLTVCNILEKHGFNIGAKAPFYTVLGISIAYTLYQL